MNFSLIPDQSSRYLTYRDIQMWGGECGLESVWSIEMSTDSRASIPGIVKNGVVVPQANRQLAEGTHVEIIVDPEAMSTELKQELEAWDQANELVPSATMSVTLCSTSCGN